MSKAIIKLNWTGMEPDVDPFAALSGEVDQELVSTATCSAKSESEVDSALSQLVHRTALIARRLVSDAERVLFLWDPVYSEMKIVFTDDTLYRDRPLVTKVKFPLLDADHSALSNYSEEKWDRETKRFARRLRQVLEKEVAAARFPSKMSVYFSDQDRESIGPDEFEASQISAEWRPL